MKPKLTLMKYQMKKENAYKRKVNNILLSIRQNVSEHWRLCWILLFTEVKWLTAKTSELTVDLEKKMYTTQP